MTAEAVTRVVTMDIDNTLLRGQSQKHLARALFAAGMMPVGALFRAQWWFLRHRFGWRPDNPTQLQAVAMTWLRGVSEERLDRLYRQVVEQKLTPLLRPEAVSAIRTWQAAGAFVILVSASIEPIVRHLAQVVAADDYVATRLIHDGPKFSGRIEGEMVTGAAKWERLREYADRRFPAWRLEAAYGDDEGDLALLERAGSSIAVVPSMPLRAIAAAQGWEIVAWT